jgi:hypothetical protein
MEAATLTPAQESVLELLDMIYSDEIDGINEPFVDAKDRLNVIIQDGKKVVEFIFAADGSKYESKILNPDEI